MLEIYNSILQQVTNNANVTFDTIGTKSGCCEYFKAGGGKVTLIKAGRYLVTFSGNVAIATGGTLTDGIELAITENGDPISWTTMQSNPSALALMNNVSTQTYVDVPNCCGHTCCVNIAVNNTGDNTVNVLNPNLTVVRVAGW